MTNDVTTEVVDGRRSVYGEPSISFPLVAQVWSGILGTEVRPDQVPLLLIGYKLVRASECPEYSDNIDDVDGYAKIFREVMGDRLISARSVTEFLEKREQRERQAAAQAHRAKIAPAEPGKHNDTCVTWNRSWAGGKWPFVCVCWMDGDERAAIARERTETEVATPPEPELVDGQIRGQRP